MGSNRQFHTVRGYQLLNQEKRILTSAMEDYLEMIYRHSLDVGSMRINTLAELLHVHPSSATKMVQRLSAAGVITYKKYGIIFLTEKGQQIGEFLYNRHNIIETFFNLIRISDHAFLETELIEHHIQPDTLENIDLFNQFIEENPDIAQKFEEFKKQSLPIEKI